MSFLRTDTVVSQFPDFDEDNSEKTRLDRGVAKSRQARRAVAALDELPPLPAQWGSAASKKSARGSAPDGNLRVVPPPPPRIPATPPKTMTNSIPAPPGLASGKAGNSIAPIPTPCFEPSVVAEVASLRAPAPDATPVPATPSAQLATATQGKVIVMFGCRGGAGTTTLAVNTAATLARQGRRVAVVDLDMQLGDVFVALDLEATTSIAALAREASTIDDAALKRRMARHDCGVYAINQVGAVDDIDANLSERLPALMAKLTDHFDYVIVDGVRDFGDYALGVLDMADQIAMVLTQDVAAVRRAARAITLFRRLGYSDKKLKLVLNRANRRAKVDMVDIIRALGLSIHAQVRNSYKKMAGAFDDGALIGDIAPKSGINKDLGKLAKALVGAPTGKAQSRANTAPVKAQKKSIFSFLKKEGGPGSSSKEGN